MGSDFKTHGPAASADVTAAEDRLDLSRLSAEGFDADDLSPEDDGSVELGWMDDVRNFDNF